MRQASMTMKHYLAEAREHFQSRLSARALPPSPEVEIEIAKLEMQFAIGCSIDHLTSCIAGAMGGFDETRSDNAVNDLAETILDHAKAINGLAEAQAALKFLPENFH
ncbi:MAG: hypothetical protein U0930_04965 [Pirellulales bacterium]